MNEVDERTLREWIVLLLELCQNDYYCKEQEQDNVMLVLFFVFFFLLQKVSLFSYESPITQIKVVLSLTDTMGVSAQSEFIESLPPNSD